MNKGIYDFISQARQKGVSVGIQTNALLLANSGVRHRLLQAAPNFIGISLDGISPESFEAIRVGGSWRKTVTALQELHRERRQRGLENQVVLNISTILPDETANTRERSLAFLQEVRPFVDQVSASRLNRYQDQEFYGADGSIKSYDRREATVAATPKCQEPFYKINVLWDGTVTPCCADISGSIPLGSMVDSGVDAVWNGQEAIRHITALLQDSLQPYPDCVRCSG